MPRKKTESTRKKAAAITVHTYASDTKTVNSWVAVVFALILCGGLLSVLEFTDVFGVSYSKADFASTTAAAKQHVLASATTSVSTLPPLNTFAYDAKLKFIANVPSAIGTTSATTTKKQIWPVKTAYPKAGALLPFSRIVAYYGNFYSTKMGVLGKYPPETMIPMLLDAAKQWQAADPSTPVIPGIDYIAVTAQGSAGSDGMYRARMPASQIQEAISLANQVHGVVILDIQVGLSNVQTEVPLLAPYLKLSNVELAIDPEFSMKDGAKPGTEIGTFDASDVNWTANYLAKIVDDNNLPPKILVVHRFTENMVTRYKNITPLPEVQLVMDMDGWGSQAKKINTYTQFVENEPVQFTGFKLFYVNDLRAPSTGMFTPSQVLKLTPQPLFIQYQ